MTQENNDNQPPAGKPRRRPRYAGTHPRRFEERYKELNPQAYPEIGQHVRDMGRTPAGTHVPIMVEQIVQLLDPKPGEAMVDCTLGYGGHAQAFIDRLEGGTLVGMDVDGGQLERTRVRLEGALRDSGRVVRLAFVRGNFAGLAKAQSAAGLDGFDIIFADLGVSSMQIDDPSRGFSYKTEGPLDMRMDDRIKRSAADVLATISHADLSAALADLADEPDAHAIAAAIVGRRQERPIRTTLELAEIVEEVKASTRRHGGNKPASVEDARARRIHAAALTFQALRILVNDELASLSQLLRLAPFCLRPAGRIGIISFHSGEDRLVKQAFRQGLRDGIYEQASEEIIRPTRQEIHDNPRSSPAKFRWARRGRNQSS